MKALRCTRIILGFLSSVILVSTDSVADEAANKELAKRWMKEVWQDHNSAYINEISTEDFDRAEAMAFSERLRTFKDSGTIGALCNSWATQLYRRA